MADGFWLLIQLRRALLGSFAFFLFGNAADASPRSTSVSFSSGGRRISTDFYAASATTDQHKTVIVLHGAGGMLFDGPEMRRIARHLADDGVSVFILHYFNRTDTLVTRDATMQKYFDTWAATVRDGIAWAVQRGRQGRRPPSSVGIYGYSLGGFLAVACASDNKKVGAVAEQAGGIWNNQERRVDRLPPVLVIHGDADQRVPLRQYGIPLVAAIERKGTSVEKRIYRNEGHRFSASAATMARAQVAGFFRRKL